MRVCPFLDEKESIKLAEGGKEIEVNLDEKAESEGKETSPVIRKDPWAHTICKL